MKILVTGAAGYLGSVVVPRLLQAGFSVLALDNFMYRPAVPAGLLQSPELRHRLRRRPRRRPDCRCMARVDAVIPLACLTGAPLCSRDPVGAESIVVDGVREILKHRSRQQPIVYPTTNSGYGSRREREVLHGRDRRCGRSACTAAEGGRGETASRRRQRGHVPPGHGLRR